MAREPDRTQVVRPSTFGRISQDVTDIASVSQLVRFAAAGQVEQLSRQRPEVRQAKVAEAAGFGSNTRNAAAALSHAMKSGFSAGQLQRLDQVLGTILPYAERFGGLSELATRLAPESHLQASIASMPSSWTGRLLNSHPSSELDVLVQASAALRAFMVAERVDLRTVERIRDRYEPELAPLARRLIQLSVSPPGPSDYDPQLMLGRLAHYVFEPMQRRLDTALRYSPLGFRVWQAITTLVKVRSENVGGYELQEWVHELISDSAELRKHSLYAGMGLDLELALAVPAAWSPPSNDWAGEALLARCWDNEATIRERSTAAMGLWQRAIEQDRNPATTSEFLRRIISEYRNPQSRPDAAAGLRWAAATLEQVIENQVAVCNEWPEVNEPWYRHVLQAASELDSSPIPDHLRAGTRSLFLHMVLQNSDVYRRRAVHTVVASGMTSVIARALGSLLKIEQDEAWLRTRAEYALGSLQRADRFTEESLTHACRDAYSSVLKTPDLPPRARMSELHASLFAIGDCFGSAGVEGDRARSVRATMAPILKNLAGAEGEMALVARGATRAAAYLLTVMAQPREGGRPDLSQELLERMTHHPDEVTARISRWAVSFRFAPDGTVRPLLAAADVGVVDDSPY